MEARIVEFAEVLRQNGVRVATSELLDASRAATLVDLSDREAFRAVLRTTMVKRSADRAPFDRAFDVFFSGAVSLLEGVEQSLLDELAASGALEGDERTMTIATLNRLLGEMSPLTRAALQADRARLTQLFRGATLQLDFSRLQSPLQAGFYARRLLAGAGGDGLRTDIGAIEDELRRRGISTEGLEWVSRRLSDVLRGLEADARREVERQARARLRGTSSALAERSFTSLSRAELTQVQHAVRRLAERLKTRLVRRERSRRKGTLNVRRTLRRNMSWGGMPMVPVFRARRPQRPEVVVLCDVSESVRNVSRLMLLFTHTLQSLFARVRSFVFVSDLGEVTELFRTLEPERALDLAVTGKAVSLQSNSNYGNALASFVRRELPAITRRTTVLVIGDGRNNQNPPNVWALREIRRKARRLVWICPEERQAWGVGDSEMDLYARVCDQVVVVQSLSDLDRLADQLVPAGAH
jgi:hypothetical protein